jgi:hypothetical protein
MQDCHEWVSSVSNSDPSAHHRLDCLLAKFDGHISGAGSVITRLNPYTNNSPVHLNLNQMAPNAASLPGIRHVSVSYADTAIQKFHDILCWQIGLPNLQCMIYQNESHDIWHMARILWCTWKWLNCAWFTLSTSMCTWPQVSGAPQHHYWQMFRSPLPHHSQNSTQAIYPNIGHPRNL